MFVRKEPAISSSLVLLAVMCFLLFPGRDRAWCLAGMILSFVGDVLLLDSPAIRQKIRHYFPLGALAFGLAHICYGTAYMDLTRSVTGMLSANIGTAAAICVMAGVLVVFVGACFVKKKYEYLPVLFLYVFCIGTAFSAVFIYAFSVGRISLRGAAGILGAIVFLMSDCCLGASRIAGMKKLGKLIWVFYPIGQCLLIVCG